MIKFFRKYEKYIFWGIVAVILPAFPISGVMLSTCGRQGPKAMGELYGRAVMQDDFEQERLRLSRFQRFIGGGGEFNDRLVWDHMAFLEQANRAGIDVTDDEVAVEVTRLYKQVQGQRKAYERMHTEFGEIRDQRTWNQIFQYLTNEEAAKASFDFDGYQAMLKQYDLTSTDFERTFRELLRIQKLQQAVGAGVEPDVEKLYEAYQEQSHKRKGVFVAFRVEDYPIGATASAEDLKRHYDKNPERFREPARVSIEWLSVPVASFEADVPQPTDAELQARYDMVKARYRVDAPAPVTPTPGVTPTAVAESYRPLAEVKGDLAKELRDEKKLDLAARKAEELRAKALAATGTAVALQPLADGKSVLYGASGLVEELDLIKFPDILFWNLLNTVAKLTPAAPYSEVARHDARTSAFFIRLVERKESAVPPFEACRAKVEESYLHGLDEELRKYHAEHADKYKTPATSNIEWVNVPYARFEKQVPETVTGTERAAELRKKAEARLVEVRQAAAEKGADGKPRDLEAVALDKGAEAGRGVVTGDGKDCPAVVKSTESLERLHDAVDKIGELSPIYESEDKAGVFFYVVRQHKAEQQLTLAEAKERVRKDLLDDRAADRARDAAEAFAKEVAARPEGFRAAAAAHGYKVEETPFLGRKEKDKVPGFTDGTRLLSTLFALPEVGMVSGASQDQASRTTYVVRFAAKEPAPAAGFADARKDLAKSTMLVRQAREDAEKEWHDKVLLEAQSVDEEVLKEVYGLRYGPDGLARVEASQIFVAMDEATVKAELGKRAKQAALAALADVRKGQRFDEIARKRSQDSFKKRGGDTGFWKRGALPRELAGLTEIDNAVFAQLRPGETSEPIETRLGWHLVQLVERRGPDEARIRHMLFRSERVHDEDGNLVPLDPEVEKAAFEKAREKAEKAEKRLAAGEDFLAVARDLSDEPFLATKRSYDFETAFERDAFAQALGQVSAVLAVDAERWQLLLVDDGSSRADRDSAENVAADMKPRMVRRIEAKGDRGKKKLDGVREELLDFAARLERESETKSDARGRSSFDFRKKFEELAKDESDAPSGARGGRVGIFRPDPSLVRFGAAFRDALFALQEGETSKLVKSPAGYHIIRLVTREKKTFEEARRDVADALLDGLTF